MPCKIDNDDDVAADEILIIVGSSVDDELGNDESRDKESSQQTVTAI